jgi:predicted CxxxxCH...CXXCH cytochrome family protein
VCLALALGVGFLPAPAAAQTSCDAAGAHLSHTRDSRSRRALACAECHPEVCAPSPPSNVVFGVLAAARGYSPSWTATTRTCAGVYCHGAREATWTYVDPAVVKPPEVLCATCHGYPPAAPHPQVSSCNACHPGTVLADGTVDLAGGKHVNGLLDVSGGSGGFGCAACHAFPPATGAHVAHFGLAGAEATASYVDASALEERYPGATPTEAPAVYAFGCATCHSLDEQRHLNGVVDVLLYEAAAPAASLKGRASPTAAFDRATGTCSGTYCHSTGQQAPTFKTTPAWTSGAHLGCAGCHDNPPAYASGGAASATANSHLGLADDGYEYGHFLGMPGPFHTSKHGGTWGPTEDASPITCQACHYDTTDPSNTGPGGFYYLDTTGTYAVPGGDPYRISSGWQAAQQCSSCHGPGSAATGAGKVLPLRHVNGVRDVAFDPRSTLPAMVWLPAAPNRPTRPYWVTGTGTSLPWPAGVAWSGTTVSFDLAGAAWNPTTKTCSNVACHLADAQPVWGRPYEYFTNGAATCYRCHPL